MGVLCSSNAHRFYVGGDDGWTLHPSRNYNHWAEKYRFLINDELVFKYKKGHDSVLVVNRNDYSKCNKENPMKALKSGDSSSSIFKLEKSGPFFFISGHDQNCEKGQKLDIIVLSPRHHNITPSSAPKAPTIHHSPTPSPSPAPFHDSGIESSKPNKPFRIQ
ncbi:early nodulin-like protein 2 [Phtheirospermum japonicum]|uniref:Early nodulin-like protein 2 n=1 Tax=Phtheirospermum japonicum TaxID=374723 RepID=A0A830BVQ5_9LAMI|nr:early nodulin-like protein 2 [Phtheirospermum japonicum]